MKIDESTKIVNLRTPQRMLPRSHRHRTPLFAHEIIHTRISVTLLVTRLFKYTFCSGRVCLFFDLSSYIGSNTFQFARRFFFLFNISHILCNLYKYKINYHTYSAKMIYHIDKTNCLIFYNVSLWIVGQYFTYIQYTLILLWQLPIFSFSMLDASKFLLYNLEIILQRLHNFNSLEWSFDTPVLRSRATRYLTDVSILLLRAHKRIYFRCMYKALRDTRGAITSVREQNRKIKSEISTIVNSSQSNVLS